MLGNIREWLETWNAPLCQQSCKISPPSQEHLAIRFRGNWQLDRVFLEQSSFAIGYGTNGQSGMIPVGVGFEYNPNIV